MDARPGGRRKIKIRVALRLRRRKLERAMKRQFEKPVSPRELEEREAWRRIQDAAAERLYPRY